MNLSKNSPSGHLFSNACRRGLVAAALSPLVLAAQTRTAVRVPRAGADAALPAWTRRAGARRHPAVRRVCSANAHGATGDGVTNNTAAIQRAIDSCSRSGGGRVVFASGQYVTGALFLEHDVDLHVDAGVTLFGSQNDDDYPERATRVAGIEMSWPAALINVVGQRNVKISGGGTIDGRGQKWWDRYWAMRKNDYEPRGLRWAVDYDAKRVRLIVLDGASDVTVEGVHLKRSGFWTVQVLYSNHVTVDGITISDNQGPSTDGVDIDSSSWVLVANTDIANNDDTICLKAGRDFDGLRVNRPTEYVVVRDNVMHKGAGILSFGSETSGGIRHVVAIHNEGNGVTAGLIFKSARTRGGFVSDVLVRDMTIENATTAFSFTLDWNPAYSHVTLPMDTVGIPAHWRVLATPVVPPQRGLADFSDITIEDVRVVNVRRIFAASGLAQKPIHGVLFRNVTAEGEEAGTIAFARDWEMDNVRLTVRDGAPVKVTASTNVGSPLVEARRDRNR